MKKIILLLSSLMLISTFAFSQGKGIKVRAKTLEVGGQPFNSFVIDTSTVAPANGGQSYVFLSGWDSETNIYTKVYADTLDGVHFEILGSASDQSYSYTIIDHVGWEEDTVTMYLPKVGGQYVMSVADFTDSLNTETYFSTYFYVKYMGSQGNEANDTVTHSPGRVLNYGQTPSCLDYPDDMLYMNGNYLYFKKNSKWYRWQINSSW